MLAVFWPIIIGQVALVHPLPIQMPALLPPGYNLLNERLAAGPTAGLGDRVTVHFRVVSGERILADTEARGLPFSFVVGDASVVPMLQDLVLGLSDRSVRHVHLPASLAAAKAPSLFPTGVATDLKVYVRVIGLVK